MGQLLRECRVWMAAVALLFGAAANADWQLSSTPDRMVDSGSGHMGIGPQCNLVQNAGRSADGAGVLRMPRGALEMFIDAETVEYRNLGAPMVAHLDAPVIQFHGMVPAQASRSVEETFYRYSGKSVTEERTDLKANVYNISYELVDGYGALVDHGMSTIQTPPTDPMGTLVTDAPDPHAAANSAFWVNYPMSVYTALRDHDKFSLRIYFPGYAFNNMANQQAHYARWNIDVGQGAMDHLCTCVKNLGDKTDASHPAHTILAGLTCP